jgi:hypothetical protein
MILLPSPIQQSFKIIPDVFCSCVNSSAFEIRVCFELQSSITILEVETTYTNIQGFSFGK